MTSVLYPRLLATTALELHQSLAGDTPERRTARAGEFHPSAVFAATGGRRVGKEELRDLRVHVLEAARRAGFPEENRRRDRGAFDLEVAQLLHERTGLVAAEAAVRPVWAFLALVLLPDVTYWRYPDPPLDRTLGTDITRHVWGRLWWRAHLLALPGQVERYRLLDTFGEAAFDQIFARRRSIGGSRAMVRALAEVWPSVDRGGVNERDLLMDVLKRLLRAGALVEFESLEEGELRRQIGAAASESSAALVVWAEAARSRHERS